MLITSLVAKPIDGDINSTNEDVTQNLIFEQVTSNEQKNIAEEVEKVDENHPFIHPRSKMQVLEREDSEKNKADERFSILEIEEE